METESPLLAGELKELRRVFDHLCFFMPKNNLRKRLNPIVERKQKIITHRKNPDAVKIFSEAGAVMSEAEIDEEFDRLLAEIEKLEEQIAEFDQRPERRIRPQDLNEALRHLGKRCTKKEIEDTIWEVDENLDGCVDWEEFKLMYERNITDKTGLEPFQLFNVVQFMMYDKDYSGKVSIDETMTMLFQRYGKDKLESVRGVGGWPCALPVPSLRPPAAGRSK